MKASTEIFIAGIIFHSAVQSLHQDILGMEKYLQHVAINWVDSIYTVPVATIMALGAIWILIANRTKVDKKEGLSD